MRYLTPRLDGQASFVIVDNGQPVPGLAANDAGLWGSAQNQSQYARRSGAGVDAHGNLIDVGGLNLTLQALAAAMTQAKVVRGMEREIHSDLVSFASWAPSSPGHVSPTKLLPDMTRAANRYLAADQRDFFYVTLR